MSSRPIAFPASPLRLLGLLSIAAISSVATLGIPGTASAVTTRFFRAASPEEFGAGKLNRAMISSLGVVSSGFDVARSEVAAGVVWSSVEAPDGTVYLGSGNRGEIFAVRGTHVVPFAKVDALIVTSLAVGNGRLYAGSMPEGKVFEIQLGGATGSSRELCKLSAEHVWALRHDGRRGILYAATGSAGKLFAIESSGKNRVAYESGEKHILSLALASDGSLFLGTADKAVVMRFDPRSGRALAVQDFDADEIRALTVRGDTLYVAVNKFDVGRSIPPAASFFGSASQRQRAVGPGSPAAGSTQVAPLVRKGKGQVWRIDPDGRSEMIYLDTEGYFTAIDTDAERNVYVGSGSKGRVVMIQPDRTAFTAFEFRERQVLTLSMGRTPVVGTGDAGAVYRVLGQRPRNATYTSKVLDAKFPSRWGNIAWRGTGNLYVETRSGNTAEPDKTWAPWIKAGLHSPSRIASPQARYLQYRVGWDKDPQATLREVQVYFLNQNQRPRIASMLVAKLPPRKGEERQSGQLKLTWNVENPDGDDLVYRVFYRAEDEQNWKLLTRPDPLTKAEFVWSTESVPHGNYRVKVVASDERANPPGAALIHERVSAPILIDNAKPEIVDLRVKFPEVSGRARDGQSRIARIEYSIDGGEWVFIFPKDGIFDDQVEPFAFRIGDRLAAGQHSLAIRAYDAVGNVGATQLTFTTR